MWPQYGPDFPGLANLVQQFIELATQHSQCRFSPGGEYETTDQGEHSKNRRDRSEGSPQTYTY